MKNIAITLDKNYCIHAAVMLYSLLSHNNPSEYKIHIVLNFKNKFFEIPLRYVLYRKRCNYQIYFIDDKDIEFANDLVITNHVTIATYFRLFLPSILKNINTLLFLDCDLVINGNIDDLFNTNIKDKTLAAVTTIDEERIKTLGLKGNYFNAGVMLLNLEYLRAHYYESKFAHFIKNNKDKIHYWDQDVLNSVTEGTTVALDDIWNCMSYNYTEGTNPKIIHFAGIHKPWGGLSQHIFKEKYFYYLHKDFILSKLNTIYEFYFRIRNKVTESNK